MGLPQVSREAIVAAAAQWSESDESAEYDWKINRYALVIDGAYYPPKRIISIATGRGVDTFSGGKTGANKYLAHLGFTVLDLAEVGRESLGLAS
jgi:hypothetical protein